MAHIQEKSSNLRLVQDIHLRKLVWCPAPYTNKPILGMDVVTGLKHGEGLNYTNGRILDPNTGKIYSMKAKLSSNGKRLHLRGYLGVSALGRNQIWIRND